MKKVLFIGNFLSAQRGTIGPVEGVMDRLQDEIKIQKASGYDYQLIKLADMVFKASFYTYDIIHIDTYSSNALYFSLITAFIGKFRKKKVVLNLHGGALYNLYFTNKLKQKLIKRLFSKASTIISPSLYLQDKFSKEGYRVEYIPNSVDSTLFPYIETCINNHKLLWVRAFNSTYQPDLAIKTLYEVRKTFPDTTLTMIGPDKGLLSESRRLIFALGLEKFVTITGKVANHELSEFYTTHQVFLNTTNTESFGVAVMEAAFSGTPVVSTSVGELPYLWNSGQDIQLVESFDVKIFAKAVCHYFEDFAFYTSVKENAHRKTQYFIWEVVKEKWLEVLT